MDSPSDKTLVSAALRGNSGAWEGLVHRYYGLVFGIALARLGDVEAAEDLAQEVFLRLFVQLRDLRNGDRFAPWAAGTARNLAANWKRDRQARSRLVPMIAAEEATMAEVPDPRPTARDHAEREEQQRLVRGMIATLPEDERELVLLHFIEGCSQRELARRLGVNVSTISRRLDASLKRLRKQFDNAAAETLRCDEGMRSRAAARAGALAGGYLALPQAAKAAVAAEASKMAVPVGVAATTASLFTGVTLMSAKKTAIMAAVVVVLLTLGGVVVTNLPGKTGRPESRTEQVNRQTAGTPRTESASSSPPIVAAPEDDELARRPFADARVAPAVARPEEQLVSDGFDGVTLIVRGRVLNDRRQPIEGAEVRLSHLHRRAITGYSGAGHPIIHEEKVETTTVSAANGSYELRSRRDLPAQILTVSRDHEVALELVKDQQSDLRPLTSETWLLERDFVLQPAPALRGRVVDDDDQPIGDATVAALVTSADSWFMHARSEFTTTTDAGGGFSFDGLGNRGARLVARKEGLTPVRHEVEGSQAQEVVLRLSRQVQSVSGIVTDWDGEPVADASVSLGSARPPNMGNPDPIWFETMSGKDGRFVFEHVPPASYFVIAQTRDGRKSLSRDNRPYEPLSVAQGRNVDSVVLRLFEGYEVRGTVSDSVTGEPIAGATVSSMALSPNDERNSTTDAEGMYVLAGVHGVPEFGSGMGILVTAGKEGYRFSPDALFPGGLEPQVNPEPGQRVYTVDLQLLPTVEWAGRVLLPDGGPAVGAQVLAVGESGPLVRTDHRGSFTVEVAANRRAQLVATAEGFPPTYSQPVRIGAEAPSPVEIRLDPGATAILRVEDEAGKPVSGAHAGLMIRTYGETWSSASRREMETTPVDGRLTFTALPTEGFPKSMMLQRESITFNARKDGYGTPDEVSAVTFQSGERKEVVIKLPPLDESGVFAGLVTDPDGRPLPNVQINFEKSPDFFHATTGSDGRFRKEKIPQGAYYIKFHHVEHGYEFKHNVEAGTEDLDVVMGKNRVMLTVLLVDAATGEPVRDGRVTYNQWNHWPVGISDIVGAHRFPQYGRTQDMPLIITAPGYPDLEIPAPKIPEGEREFIFMVEMTRPAP